MADIKIKDVTNKSIKTLNKEAVATEKFKDNIVNIKEKDNSNIAEYGGNKIESTSSIVASESTYKFNKYGKKSVFETKENIQKTKAKIKTFKEKRLEKKSKDVVARSSKKTIKTSEKVTKNTKKTAKQSVKAADRARKLAIETAKRTYQGAKLAIKATIATIKAIIAGTKALISLLLAGGWIALVFIIIICLIGLLVGSFFGIFFSGEKTSSNSYTMKELIAECNQEFSDKLQTTQDKNPHEDYVLEGSMATWKDMLLIYTVKVSNGINEQEVVTIDENKKTILKQIFWDMNSITSEVKTEMVIEQGVNSLEKPKEVQKQVLHIKITSKTAEQMKNEYYFNPAQIKQYIELSKQEYSMLWNGVVYGIQDSGEYISWRQKRAPWSNIRIGNTTSTINDIGCLVTSVAILIKKSGVNTPIEPFNPGTFVEALNKNGGFDSYGNLQYAAISKIVPDFKYVDNVNLRGKSRTEKLALITQYFNAGYYITVEVKGATLGNQHWVAVIGINGNDIIMVDPATNHTNMWNAYQYDKTSQFNYFKVN